MSGSNHPQAHSCHHDSDAWSFQHNRPDQVSYPSTGPPYHHIHHHGRSHPPVSHIRRSNSQQTTSFTSASRSRPRRASNAATSILRPWRKRCSEPDATTRQASRHCAPPPHARDSLSMDSILPHPPAHQHIPQPPQRPPPPPPVHLSSRPPAQHAAQLAHPRLAVPSLSENDYTDLRNMFHRPGSPSLPRAGSQPPLGSGAAAALTPTSSSSSSSPSPPPRPPKCLVRGQISESE
ncbi:hypothetical protein BROUX41_004455 [Berkeleyomyces rouxiae]|uniref:uncharacterized protein n=1 Tax=Berkeleyomyces rouxiae TaxID=2035830 RepID=UPI003B79AE6E